MVYRFCNFFLNGCHRLSIFDGFQERFFGYWWVEFHNIKFYERNCTLIFDCVKRFYNWFGVEPLINLCFSLILLLIRFKVIFLITPISDLAELEIWDPTFRMILEIYFMIFKSDKGFALIELFYSIVEFKLSCNSFCFSVDVLN